MMDWTDCAVGAWMGLGTEKQSYQVGVMQWAVCRAVEALAVEQVERNVDSRFGYCSIDDITPTFENSWDYEWPSDFK